MEVVNKYKHTPTKKDLYIGRGSLYGNPYSHIPSSKAEFTVETREEAVEAYRTYFKHKLETDPKFKESIDSIPEDAILVCFCKPKDCHGDIIAEYKKHGTLLT